MSKRDRPDEFTIITPVSPLLGAIDLARTSAFYRDVLGFDVHRPDGEPQALEVVSGEFRVLDIEGNQITFGQPFE